MCDDAIVGHAHDEARRMSRRTALRVAAGGAHTAILGGGRYAVEAMANLEAVPAQGSTVAVGAPRFAGGTGGPARVLALV